MATAQGFKARVPRFVELSPSFGMASGTSAGSTRLEGESPKRARLDGAIVPHTGDDDPDKQLDRLLDEQDGAPAWAVAMQASLDRNLLNISEMFGGVHSRLSVLEAANAAPPSDPKVAELSKQVERLTKLVENRQFESAPPSPPSASPTSRPYAQIPPPQFDPWSNYIGKASNTTEGVPRLNKAPAAPRLPSSADDDTDYNHVVVGGWEEDTVKRQIQQDLGKLLATFTIEYKRAISKDIIYGPRACTAHLYLHPLEPVQARDRFYALQAAYNKTVRTASGNEMWLSPSRSPERRFQNRITGVAGKLILALWPEGIQTPVLEYNYRQQIVWAEGVRVAAASQDHLRAKSSHKLGTTELSDASGQGASYHFNISALSRLTGLDEATVEIKLHEEAS